MAIKDSEGPEANRAVQRGMQAGVCGATGAYGRALERAEELRTDCGMRGSCPSERLGENTAIPSSYALSTSPCVRPRGQARPEEHKA